MPDRSICWCAEAHPTCLVLDPGRECGLCQKENGCREGVDDLRYMTTLLRYIDLASSGPHESLADSARQWLERIDIENDLTSIRRQTAEWITRLHKQCGPAAGRTILDPPDHVGAPK